MAFYFGADDETRTHDLILTKDVLYLLSYISMRNSHANVIIIKKL